MENVLAGTRMAAAVKSVLTNYLEDALVDRIIEEIGERYIAERTDPSYDEMIAVGKAFPNAPVRHHSGPVYRPVDPDGEYPVESSAHHQSIAPSPFVPIGEVRRVLVDKHGYIKENTEAAWWRLYDRTGTFVGRVSEATMKKLELDDVITTRHEDETYKTYWAKEGNRDGAGST